MKIVCSKGNLLNGVNIVSKAVPAKTSMSILQCILVKANKGTITLTGNDGELGIETIIEGPPQSPTISVHLLYLCPYTRNLLFCY